MRRSREWQWPRVVQAAAKYARCSAKVRSPTFGASAEAKQIVGPRTISDNLAMELVAVSVCEAHG